MRVYRLTFRSSVAFARHDLNCRGAGRHIPRGIFRNDATIYKRTRLCVRSGSPYRLKGAIWPHVRTAHGRERDADEGIRRLHDLRRLAVLKPDVARAIKDCSSHGFIFTLLILMAMVIPT